MKYLLVALLFANALALAQVNTEKMRRRASEEGLQLEAAASGSIKTGNSEYVNVASRARLDYYALPVHVFLVGNFEFKEGANNVKQEHEAFAHARGVYRFSPIVSAEAFAQKEFDEFKSLVDRNLLGAGARVAIIGARDSSGALPGLEAHVGVGAMFENETYDIGGERSINLVRSTNYLSLDWRFEKTVSFSLVSYFQFDVADIDDFRSLTQANLAFSLSDNLAITSGVNYFHDGDPEPTVKRYDFEAVNGIVISL
jgi:hypothetical protein